MSNSSIASLAILKVNWNTGSDYVENFVPFLLEAIRASKTPQISVSDIQVYIKDSFGLSIPQGALNTLLKRAANRGFVIKNQGIYVRADQEIESSISTVRADALRQQRALFKKLADFANRVGLQWSEEDASTALLAYLETECIPVLAAHINGQAIPEVSENSTSAQLAVNEFIVSISQSDPEAFSFLETVVKGHMLATALFLPDISKASQKFKDLSVYLDTKILLRALGFEGEGQKRYCREFLELLYQSNVSLYCFSITLDEVKRILTAAQHFLRHPGEVNRPFLVYEYFVAQGISPSDVEIILNDLPGRLQQQRIYVREHPPYTAELGLNEQRLEQLLKVEMPDQADESQRHDISCLTAIYRLRRGQTTSEIEKSKFLFVTPNNAIAKASSKFFAEHYGHEAIPFCLNDHTLATLAWVKHPDLDNGLQRDRLIATAYAGIQPSPRLWKQYLDEINRLRAKGEITEADYYLLRSSTVARTALVETTRGDASAFTEGTVPEVIEKARAEARKDVETKLTEEISRREQAEATVRSANQQLEEVSQKFQARLDHLSSSLGRFIKIVLTSILAIVVIVGMYKASALPLNPDIEKEASLLIQVALAVSFIAAVYSQMTGGSIREIGRRIEVASAKRARKLLAKLFSV